MSRALMIQGTGSNVGKSLVVAGLLRAFRKRGLSVVPFKPQNMSNNAAVSTDGGELGRAQALQALAAGVSPHTDMNPVLLKPESDMRSQVVVQGQGKGNLSAGNFRADRENLLKPVLESFSRLAQQADLVIVEGAGSPAETNLRKHDIANMGFATAANVPVVLLGDIDRGGVIAQLVGTKAVLSSVDAEQIVGFMINKFRGNLELFDDGLSTITHHTGWLSAGILTWFPSAWKLPAEDAVDLTSSVGGHIKIVVPMLSRIANFDDLDPLRNEPEVTVEMVSPGNPLPGDADLVLLPGTKSTIADLAFFKSQGWDVDLVAHHRRGGRILGLCGGYQMLGRTVSDPQGIEGVAQTVAGLGLLEVETEMSAQKVVAISNGHYLPTGDSISGYEIHIGKTGGADKANAWLNVDGQDEGAESEDGLVRGCYLHGIFTSDSFRASFLREFGAETHIQYSKEVDSVLDELAAQMENQLDLDLLYSFARTIELKSL